MVSFALITSSGDPLSYRDVEEMGSLQKNKTWESSSMLTKSVQQISSRVTWTWLMFAACKPLRAKVEAIEEFARVA